MQIDTSSLKHVRRKLRGGGEVIVVDTGAILTPETLAMIQAKHSRSIHGFDSFMAVLAQEGVDKFMDQNYVKYGHKSIGDCGWAVVFIEGVPMLVPKAVQDWDLYNGQESSTRFMDFAVQPFVNPLETAEGEAIQERWRDAYKLSVVPLNALLRLRFPQNEGEKQSDYDKAIAARGFDILRGFLPAGTRTNMAWTMTLRQFFDELPWLRHHPLADVREVGEATSDALHEMFPHSGFAKRYPETEAYIAEMSAEYTYFDNDLDPPRNNELYVEHDFIDCSLLSGYRKALSSRPPKTELPRKIAQCGTMQFSFLLDFGSFRDLQRHRSVTQEMPLLTMEHGFHPWYLEEMGELRQGIEILLDQQKLAIDALDTSSEIKQYYTAMGYNTTNRLTGDLHALVYIAELRSTRFVHPTLQEKVRMMARVLEQRYKQFGLVLHMDTDPHRFDVRRGTHDFVKKEI